MSGKYYHALVALFSTTLVISNLMAVKLVHIVGLYLPAAVILFPVTYIFGNVLTEVYGYARARQAIWIGFGCNLAAVAALTIGSWLPSAPFWSAGSFGSPADAQLAYQAILGFAPRLLLASFVAYLVGEFLNSYINGSLEGRHFWQVPVGANHQLDSCRGRHGFGDIHQRCLLRHPSIGRPGCDNSLSVGFQERLRDFGDAVDICGGEWIETR